MAAGKLQQVDLMQLPLPHLHQIKQQLDQELALYQNTLGSLKHAQMKFQESGDSIAKLTPESEGRTVLLPLTSSMYVPGKITNVKTVLLDIGTGYFVEKNLDGAKDYFKRKVKFLTEQIEKVQAIGSEKNRVRDAVMEVMEIKVQAQLVAQMKNLQPPSTKA